MEGATFDGNNMKESRAARFFPQNKPAVLYCTNRWIFIILGILKHGLRPSKSLKTSEPGFQGPEILSKTDTQNTTQMSNQLKNTTLIFSRRSIWLVITSRLGKKNNTAWYHHSVWVDYLVV